MAFPAKIEKALRNFPRCFFAQVLAFFLVGKGFKGIKRTIKWSFKGFLSIFGWLLLHKNGLF
jgi:hypothetical protein